MSDKHAGLTFDFEEPFAGLAREPTDPLEALTAVLSLENHLEALGTRPQAGKALKGCVERLRRPCRPPAPDPAALIVPNPADDRPGCRVIPNHDATSYLIYLRFNYLVVHQNRLHPIRE